MKISPYEEEETVKEPVRTEVETFPLEQANEALNRLRAGKIHGAAVLVMPSSSV